MKKTFLVLWIALMLSALALAACGGGGAEKASDSAPAEKVPAEYADLKNPYVGKTDAADAGKTIYTEKCATCHGAGGKGDGAGGAALNPKPADLTKISADPDGLIYWRIAEGGTAEPFKSEGSTMPAWKAVLTKDEIWQTVTYLRTLK